MSGALDGLRVIDVSHYLNPQGVAAPQDSTPQIGHYRCADGRWIQLA